MLPAAIVVGFVYEFLIQWNNGVIDVVADFFEQRFERCGGLHDHFICSLDIGVSIRWGLVL